MKRPWALYDFKTSWNFLMFVILPGPFMIAILLLPFMIMTLTGVSLWLWHILCLFMIVTLPQPLYDCGISWGLTIIPAASLWLWYILGLFMIVTLSGPLYASMSVTFPGPHMIVTLPVACLWFGIFWGLSFFYFDISCDPSMIVKGYLFYCLHYHLNLIYQCLKSSLQLTD